MRADAVGAEPDEHLRRFVDYVAGQGSGVTLSYSDVATSTTRAELGIGSLDMLILLAGYADATTGGAVTLQPEWVPMLDDVEGIRTVLVEIDRMSTPT